MTMSGVEDRVLGADLRVREMTSADAAVWDSFVACAEGATFCHLAGWQDVLRETMRCKPLYRIAAGPGGEIAGVLPLVRVRSPIFGNYLVSMPFLNYGGPLGTPEAQRLLADWARGEAERSGTDLLELRNRTSMDPPRGLRRSDRKVTVVLPLPDSSPQLFEKGFSAKLRSQIRRPIKEGMEVRFGPELVDDFYAVFSRNMRDLGTPVLPRSFFDAIARVFAREAVFGTVYHEGVPVAAGAGFFWRGEYEMTWASSLREYNKLAPNMLLYWGFMEEIIRRGGSTFNFGRCTPEGGTHRFKLQWGGHDAPLPWLQWSSSGTDSTPSPDSDAYRFAIAAWQRLPVPVANLIGPLISRQIP